MPCTTEKNNITIVQTAAAQAGKKNRLQIFFRPAGAKKKLSQNHDSKGPRQVAPHYKHFLSKITIVHAAAPQAMEKSTNPIILKKLY